MLRGKGINIKVRMDGRKYEKGMGGQRREQGDKD